MKILFRLTIWLGLLIMSATAFAQDRAILVRDSDTQFHVEVIIETAANQSNPVIAALYEVDANGKRRQIGKFQQAVTPATDGNSKFNINLPAVPTDKSSYVVSVFEFPTTDGTFSYDLPVTKLLTPIVSALTPQCPNGLQIRLNSKDYSLKDWQDINDWINAARQNIRKLGIVKVISGTVNSEYPIRRADILTTPERAVQIGFMLVCVQLEPNLPNETFNVAINFSNAPKFDLQKPLTKTGLTGAPTPKTPTSADDNGVPGQRGLERNLDLGISFSSSVGEKQNPDGTKFIGRTNRGTFDIRIAPLLKAQKNEPFDRDQKWYHFFTPVFLDAAVSTGQIDKDTLSMNRVIFGTEYEWRYYDFRKDPVTGNTKTSPYVTFHRIILSANHASDRDFKQKEFLANIEYQPVIGALNHPLYLNWKFDENGIRVPGSFGYEIMPRFGFTIGKTYQRRNPASVIQPSPTARRFYVGLDMVFNFTRFVQLSIKDTLYIRGEARDDRIHNYFKGTIEAPLGRPFANTVNSLFLSFERGNQPPFATRDVNVFKLGYRIRSEGWFDRFR